MCIVVAIKCLDMPIKIKQKKNFLFHVHMCAVRLLPSIKCLKNKIKSTCSKCVVVAICFEYVFLVFFFFWYATSNILYAKEYNWGGVDERIYMWLVGGGGGVAIKFNSNKRKYFFLLFF